MAKSNGFFSLRRGSTKSLTFSVLDGKQITKDRVTSVHNPRTSKQQYQRSIMATVMAAYSHMKAIEDHAFQGKSKGSACQREFMRLNLNKIRRAMSDDWNQERAAKDCTAFVNFPKSNELVANAYAISRGNLPSQKLFVDKSDYIEEGENYLDIPFVDNLEDRLSFTVGEVLQECGLVPGSQITFVWIDTSYFNKHTVPGAGLTAGWSYIPGVFRYKRFVVRQDVDLSHEFTFNNGPTAADIVSVLQFISDPVKTTVKIDTYSVVLEQGANYPKFILEEGLYPFDASFTGAVGIITSIEETGERDNADMVIYNKENNIVAGSIGLTWGAVPAAWETAAQLGDSDLYLEGGE